MLIGVSHNSTLSHSLLSIKHKPGNVVRERKYYVLHDISPSPRTLVVNMANLSTLRCALLERMYYCKVDGEFVSPSTPSISTIERKLRGYRSSLMHYLPGGSTPLNQAEFLALYQGRKLAVYTKAVDTYNEMGVEREHSISRVFVKMEKVKSTSAPRVIQPRDPVYNFAIGVYLKPLEHQIYRAIQRVWKSTTPIVFKGLNVVEMAEALVTKWSEFDNPVAVGLDAVKFDMHVSEAMLRWEHSVYLSVYNNDPELRKLLNWQIYNQGRGYCDDGSLKYSVRGRRFSGDMNTATGNCLIMTAMVHSLVTDLGVKAQLLNNGDDCVVVLEKGDTHAFVSNLTAHFEQFGFRLTVDKVVDQLEHIKFCQMQPVVSGKTYRFVRSIDTAREKDSIALLDISTRTAYQKWIYAVGEGGLALCSGVPVMQTMYQTYMRHGIPSGISNALQMQCGAMFLRIRLEGRVEDITQAARVSFWEAFGVTPDEQIALEEYYASLDLRWTGFGAVDSLIEINTAPY